MVCTIDLKGKLVLVTGAGRGIGVSIAKGIAEDNSTPADELAKEIAAEYGVRCRAFKMPAGDSALVDAAVKKITAELGEIDCVIANAGVCHHVDAQDTTDEQLQDTFAVNVFAPFHLARAVFRTWFPTPETPAKSKVILFVSSISGHVYNTPQTQVVYNSSKAAVTMLGKSLAGEWAPRGVRLNIVSPGYIDTDMSTGSAGGKAWSDEWMKRTPIGRFGTPKEVADLMVVLASDKATFMTGTDIILDGGYTIF
ncbi:hypothetical protein RQP46_006426 [Phenoliferia psychrophenolica]